MLQKGRELYQEGFAYEEGFYNKRTTKRIDNIILTYIMLMDNNSYVCPRCGYSNNLRFEMKRHFMRKTSCRNTNNIELTEDIRAYVLLHKVYHPPKKEDKIINYNVLMNFIGRMDYEQKLEGVLDYQQQKLIDFEDGLETKFERKLGKLENNDFPVAYQLDKRDLFSLVNDVTRINSEQINQLNILFDRRVNRILFYSCKKWDDQIVDHGITDLIRYLQSYFLDTYEKYLIKNIHGTKFDAQTRSSLLNHLEIYYKFLICVDLMPTIFDNKDEEIIGYELKENNPFYLEELYMNTFNDLKSTVKTQEKNSTKKQLLNILKENSVHNIQELNKSVLTIIKVDQQFREKFLTETNFLEKKLVS